MFLQNLKASIIQRAWKNYKFKMQMRYMNTSQQELVRQVIFEFKTRRKIKLRRKAAKLINLYIIKRKIAEKLKVHIIHYTKKIRNVQKFFNWADYQLSAQSRYVGIKLDDFIRKECQKNEFVGKQTQTTAIKGGNNQNDKQGQIQNAIQSEPQQVQLQSFQEFMGQNPVQKLSATAIRELEKMTNTNKQSVQLDLIPQDIVLNRGQMSKQKMLNQLVPRNQEIYQHNQKKKKESQKRKSNFKRKVTLETRVTNAFQSHGSLSGTQILCQQLSRKSSQVQQLDHKGTKKNKKPSIPLQQITQSQIQYTEPLIPFMTGKLKNSQYKVSFTNQAGLHQQMYGQAYELEIKMKRKVIINYIIDQRRKYIKAEEQYYEDLFNFCKSKKKEINLERARLLLLADPVQLRVLAQKSEQDDGEKYKKLNKEKKKKGLKVSFRDRLREEVAKDHLPFGNLIPQIAQQLDCVNQKKTFTLQASENQMKSLLQKYSQEFNQAYQMLIRKAQKLSKKDD